MRYKIAAMGANPFTEIECGPDALENMVMGAAIAQHASRHSEGWSDDDFTVTATDEAGEVRMFIVSAEITDVAFDIFECPRKGEGCDHEDEGDGDGE